MFAINLDNEGYIVNFSNKFRKPESVLVESLPDTCDLKKMRCYKHTNGKFVFDADKWAAIEAAQEKAARIREINTEIDSLKQQIESSDYQIIKCYEYALNNLELPYDAQALHEERQSLRDKINSLEKTLQEDK